MTITATQQRRLDDLRRQFEELRQRREPEERAAPNGEVRRWYTDCSYSLDGDEVLFNTADFRREPHPTGACFATQQW